MAEELICPIKTCRDIPIIKFTNNSSKIEIKCATHLNNGKIYDIKDYLNLCNNYNKELLCCKNCKNNLNTIFFYCSSYKGIFDEKCLTNTKCTEQPFHKRIKISKKNYFDKKVCLRHNEKFNKYCKNCKISFCEKCNLKNHEKHQVVTIDEMTKTQKEIKQIEANLNMAKNYFSNIKTIVKEYLDEMESKIQLKKIILKNYVKNGFNGNSVLNLDNIDLSIDKRYKEKIDDLLKKRTWKNFFV